MFLVLKNTAPSIEGLLVTSKPTEQRQALTICHIFKSMTHSFDEDFCEVRILSVVNGPKEHVLSSATVKTVEELKTIVKVWITDEHKRQIASTPPLREERKSTKQEKPIIKQQEKAVSKPTLPRAVTTGHIQRSQSSAAIEDNSPMFSRAHVKKLRESLGISAPTLVESPIDGKATSVLASARSCPTPRRNK